MDAHTTGTRRHLATVAGVQVEYLMTGDGPDVVLLHGLGESADDWWGLMTHLASSYRLLALTLPGYGSDRRDPSDGDGLRQGDHAHDVVEDASPEGFARFCNAFNTVKELQRPVLVGHSLGGLIALRAALDRPDLWRALVLVGSAGLGRHVTPALQAAALPLVGDVAATVARSRPGALLRAAGKAPLVFGRPWRVPPGWLVDQYRRAQDGRFMETTLRALRAQIGISGQRRVVLDELPMLSLPTLLIWGTADHVVPVAHGRAAAARLPDGRLETLSRLGHVPHVEDPARVATVVRDFLATLP